MAQVVKQGAEGREKPTLDDFLAVLPPWQTPDLHSREARLIGSLRAELGAAYERVRFWRICYLTVCAQFLVVCVAAVWGWAR